MQMKTPETILLYEIHCLQRTSYKSLVKYLPVKPTDSSTWHQHDTANF